MRKGNLIFVLTLEGLGILEILASYRLGLQTFTNPGPGLFPFVSGVLFCLLVLPICISSLKELKKATAAQERPQGNLKKVGLITLFLVAYFLFLGLLGFLIVTFIFLFGLFCIERHQKWSFNLVFAAALVGAVYLLFHTLLGIEFPLGFLEIG